MSYPAHVAAPKIEPIDLTTFKKSAAQKVNKFFDKRYKELMEEAETLQKSFQITREVYSSKYRFEPIVGGIYHLYEDSDGLKTLSIINPTEWNKKYLYSVILNSDMTWEEIKIHT